MKTVPSGTIVGYDAVSGDKLFTETNRATRFPDKHLLFHMQTTLTRLTARPTGLFVCAQIAQNCCTK